MCRVTGVEFRQGSDDVVTRQQSLLRRLQDRLLAGVPYCRSTGRSHRTQLVPHQNSARHASSTSEAVVNDDDVESSIKTPRERDADTRRRRLSLHCLTAARRRTAHRHTRRSLVLCLYFRTNGFSL